MGEAWLRRRFHAVVANVMAVQCAFLVALLVWLEPCRCRACVLVPRQRSVALLVSVDSVVIFIVRTVEILWRVAATAMIGESRKGSFHLHHWVQTRRGR
jgi:hypothetical protein